MAALKTLAALKSLAGKMPHLNDERRGKSEKLSDFADLFDELVRVHLVARRV
jgi:hypothetical protein